LQLQQAAAIKHTRLAQLLQPSLAFCFSLQPMMTAGRYAAIGCKRKQNANEGCNSCVSLVWLVLCSIAAACCSCNNFKFYCIFYFTCDRSFTAVMHIGAEMNLQI